MLKENQSVPHHKPSLWAHSSPLVSGLCSGWRCRLGGAAPASADRTTRWCLPQQSTECAGLEEWTQNHNFLNRDPVRSSVQYSFRFCLLTNNYSIKKIFIHNTEVHHLWICVYISVFYVSLPDQWRSSNFFQIPCFFVVVLFFIFLWRYKRWQCLKWCLRKQLKVCHSTQVVN